MPPPLASEGLNVLRRADVSLPVRRAALVSILLMAIFVSAQIGFGLFVLSAAPAEPNEATGNVIYFPQRGENYFIKTTQNWLMRALVVCTFLCLPLPAFVFLRTRRVFALSDWMRRPGE